MFRRDKKKQRRAIWVLVLCSVLWGGSLACAPMVLWHPNKQAAQSLKDKKRCNEAAYTYVRGDLGSQSIRADRDGMYICRHRFCMVRFNDRYVRCMKDLGWKLKTRVARHRVSLRAVQSTPDPDPRASLSLR